MTAAGVARFPGRAPIDAYGRGGFRFAGMSHVGSLLCLPSGIYAWDMVDGADVTLEALGSALAEADGFAFLLLGTGRLQRFPDAAVRRHFLDARLGLEVMDTGAAARTYNVLLAEGRPLAAALIAV